jgi:hypothetical protein
MEPEFLAEPPEKSDQYVEGMRRRATLRKERYRFALDMLIQHLGGKCAECGSVLDPTIDHVDGATWERRALSFMQRVRRYYEEYRAGVRLRVLCHGCNSTLGAGCMWRRRKAVG